MCHQLMSLILLCQRPGCIEDHHSSQSQLNHLCFLLGKGPDIGCSYEAVTVL